MLPDYYSKLLHVFQSFFGFGPSLDIDLVLDGQETRKTAEIKGEDGKLETHYLYLDGETISGKVRVSFAFQLNVYFSCVLTLTTRVI